MTRTIRASSLPLALACPASQVPPAVPLADDSPESRLGSAVHEVLADMVRGNGPTSDGIEDAAARWRVDHDELVGLCWNGKRAWDRLQEFFPEPLLVELEVARHAPDLTLTGHVDFTAVVGNEIRLGDWKTGFADEDHEQQLRAYAFMLLRGAEQLDSATAIVVRLREMTQDVYRWTRRELDAWYAGVVRDTAEVERYRAGRHCGFCPRRMECGPKVEHQVAAAAGLIHGFPIKAGHDKWGDALLAVYDRIRVVEDACAMARESLRAEVMQCGGQLPGSDGRTLALVRQERQEIQAAAAWPVLSERFPQSDLQAAAKLTKTAVTKLAMDAAPHGKKGVAAKSIIEELDAKGAICTTSVERLEVKRGNSNSIEAGDTAVSRPAITDGNGDRDPAA